MIKEESIEPNEKNLNAIFSPERLSDNKIPDPSQNPLKNPTISKSQESEPIQVNEEVQTPWEFEQKAPIKVNPKKTKAELTAYYKTEILAGVITGFVLVPQECAMALIGNLDASIGCHSAWIIGLICSIFGGRPGMINGLTGGLASLTAQYVVLPKESSGSGKGIEEYFIATMIAGVIILVVGLLKLDKLQVMIPATVKVGFCNGLAIIIG